MEKQYEYSEILSLSYQIDYQQTLNLLWDMFYDNAFDNLSKVAKIIELHPDTFQLLTQSQKKYILNKSCKLSILHLSSIKPHNINLFFSIPDKYKSEAEYLRIIMVLRYMHTSSLKFTLCKKLLKNIKHNVILSSQQKKMFYDLFNTIIVLDFKK